MKNLVGLLLFAGLGLLVPKVGFAQGIKSKADSAKSGISMDLTKIRQFQSVVHTRIEIDSTSAKAKKRNDSIRVRLRTLQAVVHPRLATDTLGRNKH